MRKLIRNRATHAFLTEGGGWTEDVTRAMPLTDEEQAVVVKDHLRLENIDLYYRYFEGRETVWDFAVPLN
jgi:hypothetical protein